jgi:hypothetical protein
METLPKSFLERGPVSFSDNNLILKDGPRDRCSFIYSAPLSSAILIAAVACGVGEDGSIRFAFAGDPLIVVASQDPVTLLKDYNEQGSRPRTTLGGVPKKIFKPTIPPTRKRRIYHSN